MLKILVVDDTRSVHAFIKGLLEATREVSTVDVYDGSEALSLFRTGAHFDLVLLDWEMPVLNGPETLEEMKGLGIRTPVIMMTTKNLNTDIEKMLNAGVAEYLMKPFTSDIFLGKIEGVSGRIVTRVA